MNNILGGTVLGNLPFGGNSFVTVQTIDIDVNFGYCTQDDLEKLLGMSKLAALTNDIANSSVPDSVTIKEIISKVDGEIDAEAGTVYTTPLFLSLTGTVTTSGSLLIGNGTLFTKQLKPNTVLVGNDGQRTVIRKITSDTAASISGGLIPEWSGETVLALPAIVHEISLYLSAYACFAKRFSIMEVPKYWLDMRKAMLEKLDKISNEMLLLPIEVSSQEASFVAPTPDPMTDFNNPNSQMSQY